MIGARFLTLAAGVFCGGAWAASNAELEAAFAKAQKKGASAYYHDRCGADGTSAGGYQFPENGPNTLLMVLGAVTAQALIKDQSGSDGCSAGLMPGQDRYYEIYPDGSVKTK